MAKIKSPIPKLRLTHGAVILLALLVVPVAIYAMTTWNDSPAYQTNPQSADGSQLPVRSDAQGIQGRPANSQELGNSSSAQLQQSTPAQTPPQQMQPPADYPPNPDPCGPPRSERPCLLQ